MKIATTQRIYIQKLFKNMNSKEDFIFLLNEAKKTFYGDKIIPFEERQLNYYVNKNVVIYKNEKLFISKKEGNVEKSFYNTFLIKKKSGGDRIIFSPVKGLKELQKALNIIIQCVHQPHPAATGFVFEKSIVDNAKVHVGQYFVCNLDLENFFPSVDQSRIWGRLLIEPFNLNNTPERKKIANMIASLVCTNMQVERLINKKWTKIFTSVLPQGAPTSPTITNAICEKLDKKMAGVAKRFGLNYTRYADDITFSGKHNSYEISPNNFERIFTKNSSFDKEIRKIISLQNFKINEPKYRLQKDIFRQEVTGLVVNTKVNVTQRYTKTLRQWLYYWETYGYDKAYGMFVEKYFLDKGHFKKGHPNMAMVISGKLLYLKMVKGDNDGTYLKLKDRFDKLFNLNDSISLILDTWEKEGIEKAMLSYYSALNKKNDKEINKNNFTNA